MPGCHQPTIETNPDRTNFLKTKMLRQIKLTQHFRFYGSVCLFGKYRELDVARILAADVKDVCTLVVGNTSGSAGHDTADFIFCRNNDTHRLAGIEHHADWAEDNVEFCYLTWRKLVNLTERVVGADVGGALGVKMTH